MADLVPGLEGDSIMEQMNKLFSPPGKTGLEDVGEAHPYFKRPGRGHNHDCCDSCSEGGALICCDLCPASFHLQCHDPPLSDSEIPEGDWSCIQCFARTPDCQRLVAEAKKARLAPNLQGIRIAGASGVSGKRKLEISSRGESEKSVSKSPQKVDSEWKPGSKKKMEVGRHGRSTRAAKGRTLYADHSTEDEDEDEKPKVVVVTPPKKSNIDPIFSHSGKNYKELYVEHLARKPDLKGNPFSVLLAAANQVNASEFELPHKYGSNTEKFPYSWKWSSEAERKRLKGTDGEELEPGQNKVRLCYTCVRSSRVGPLVRCDYCPCAFHMDCLNPPLSELPSDVWMCPNHVENFLDGHLLSSNSVTERVELWDKYARQKVDVHAVKLQFMKRCQRAKNKHFNRKHPIHARKTVTVPGHIKAQYRQPTAKLPGPSPWQDKVQTRCAGGKDVTEYELEWMSSLVSFQTQLAKEKVSKVENKLEDGVGFTNSEQKTESSSKVEDTSHSPASTLSTCSLSPRHTASLSSQPSLATQLTEYLAEHSVTSVKDLDPVVLQYLAHRQLQRIFPSPPGGPQNQVRARASLTPLGSRRTPAIMQYRSLVVGAGQTQGLDLLSYGNCNHLSQKHAVIFYDELSCEYELINYSAHGTRVDSVLYCLDLAGLEARFPVKKTVSPAEKMAGKPGVGQGGGPCHCEPGAKDGCEGSALVKHGSVLQFGCVQFVFSITQETVMDCPEL